VPIADSEFEAFVKGLEKGLEKGRAVARATLSFPNESPA
jgi:hypothetical protein